jgi:glycosyltransferase involved in cell wall biosynthesis
VGSNRETVLDGWNGFLVPYGNREALGRALVALHDNENLRRAMGQRGRSHFEGNFQPATQMEMLERFYRAEVEARP